MCISMCMFLTHTRHADRLVRDGMRNVSSVTLRVCFMNLTQLDKFMKKVNVARVCATPSCRGELTPVRVRSAGLGGASSICYMCNYRLRSTSSCLGNVLQALLPMKSSLVPVMSSLVPVMSPVVPVINPVESSSVMPVTGSLVSVKLVVQFK